MHGAGWSGGCRFARDRFTRIGLNCSIFCRGIGFSRLTYHSVRIIGRPSQVTKTTINLGFGDKSFFKPALKRSGGSMLGQVALGLPLGLDLIHQKLFGGALLVFYGPACGDGGAGNRLLPVLLASK